MKKIFLALSLIAPTTMSAQWNLIPTFESPYQTLAVPSDSHVFYAPSSKHIYYSYNAGDNWNVFQTEYEHELFEDMDFVNDSVGFVCGGGWFTPHRNIVMKTTDAGKTWETLTRDSLGTYQFLFGKIDFVNIDSGIVIDVQGYEIFRTLDGGVNWQQIYIDTTNAAIISDMYFVNDTIGFVTTIGGSFPLNKGKIYKTTDFGATWQMVKEWDFKNSFYKIHFVDALNGYVGGSGGKLFKTTDGGATWAEINIPPGNNITALWFTESNVGYSNALGTIHKTIDGGKSWFPQLMTLPGVVADIQFSPSKKTGFLVSGDYIYKTTNEGGIPTFIPNPAHQTLFKVYPNPANELIHMEYPNDVQVQHIRLVDISGKLVRTFDKHEKVLHLNGIASGVYMLNIQTVETIVSEKIIIK